MDVEEMRQIINQVKFQDYVFRVYGEFGRVILQASYIEPDIVTGQPERQKTRKWIVSKYATKSELVQTAFKCCLTSMEHRTRESFLYRGKRVFGPHFDVEVLWQMCEDKQFDYRKPEENL
jgi:hypothetical protein